MAEIIQTTLQLYKGTSASGEKVGNDIVDTTAGGPQTINLNYETLGAHLNAGEQYFVRAKALNNEGYESDWNDPSSQKTFKTLILAEIITLSGSNGNLNAELSFTYNNQVLSIQDCGIYVSTTAGGTNAQKISADDEETAVGQWQITSLDENTTYYVIPYVLDSDDREYKPEWTDAEQVNTGYAAPVVSISNIETTYNSLSGNVTVTTSDTLSRVTLSIIPTGGGSYQYKTLNAQTDTQQWAITNGDLDDDGDEITINPSTEYKISINAVNATGGSGSDEKTATTLQQATSTITITSVVPMPTSATVNLSYNNNTPVENPDTQQ